MGKVIKHDFRPQKNPSWRDRCTPEWCPCLSCEIWLNENLHPECACKPCSVPGLRNPKDVICYKTSNGEFGRMEIQNED